MIEVKYNDGSVEHVMYRDIFRSSPHNYILFAPDFPKFTMLDISEKFLKSISMKREDVVGKGLFDVFPDNPDSEVKNEKVLIESLMKIINTKESDLMPVVRYDIPVPGTTKFDIRHWRPESFPMLNGSGKLLLIFHTAVDITNIIKHLTT